MPQIFYIAGIAFLSLALILSLFASISLPSLGGVDFVRAASDNGEQRFGIWGQCSYGLDDNLDFRKLGCIHQGVGYSIPVTNRLTGRTVTIGPSWTRGLAIHPFVTVLIAIALALACLRHKKGPILASLASFFTAFFAAIAFMIDIAFYAKLNHIGHQVVPDSGGVRTGPAFWMSFVSLIFVVVGGLTACLGHRKNRAESGDVYQMNSKPGLLGRFF